MARTVSFDSRLPLPVNRIYEVLTSEKYLLTLDEVAGAEQSRIVSARREELESGTVQAVVVLHPVPPEPEGGWPDDAARQAAEKDSARREVAQVTRVTPLTSSADATAPSLSATTMTAVLPFPNSVGEVLSSFEFTGEEEDVASGKEKNGETVVKASITVAVKQARMRKAVEDAFSAKAEETVKEGLQRILRLAEAMH